MSGSRLGRVLALAVGLLLVLAAGMWLGGHPDKLPESIRSAFVDQTGGLTSEASGVIKGSYYREVGENELTDSAINGMVRSLRLKFKDRFSHYFNPKNLARFQESISGRFTGIGLTVSEVKKGLRVGKVFPKTPAAGAGIAAGDVITTVEGRSIAGQSSDLVVAKIKGPAGSSVNIGVLRPSTGKTRDLNITREEIQLPITRGRIELVNGKRLGIVQFATFSEGSGEILRRAFEKVRARGAQGVVLDMRGNGGGLLREAVLSASDFIPKGDVVVSTRSRTQGDAEYTATGDPLPGQPLVVLINRDTASAAEILTSALADNIGSTVVGTRSYGKGVFQQVMPLSNGGALDLTVGEYFTADGVSLFPDGIQPDVRVADNPKTRRVDEAKDEALKVLGDEIDGKRPVTDESAGESGSGSAR